MEIVIVRITCLVSLLLVAIAVLADIATPYVFWLWFKGSIELWQVAHWIIVIYLLNALAIHIFSIMTDMVTAGKWRDIHNIDQRWEHLRPKRVAAEVTLGVAIFSPIVWFLVQNSKIFGF